MARVDQKNLPDFWINGHFRLFISHISKNKAGAAKLQSSLRRFHISGFVAHSDIQPTREWENEILQALRTSDALIALLHTGFHESKWTDQEIGIAIGRDLLAVSISFGETPYGFLGRYQALQGTGKSYDQLAEEVFRILRIHHRTRRRISEALVDKMGKSTSFNEALDTMKLIEGVEYWDYMLSNELRSHKTSNSQVHGAYTVPQRIDQHIRRWSKDYEIPF